MIGLESIKLSWSLSSFEVLACASSTKLLMIPTLILAHLEFRPRSDMASFSTGTSRMAVAFIFNAAEPCLGSSYYESSNTCHLFKDWAKA